MRAKAPNKMAQVPGPRRNVFALLEGEPLVGFKGKPKGKPRPFLGAPEQKTCYLIWVARLNKDSQKIQQTNKSKVQTFEFRLGLGPMGSVFFRRPP